MQDALRRTFPALIFIFSLAILLPRMAPHITGGDAGELALAGSTLGVAHSPGYPLFVLANHCAATLFPWGNPAYRQNFSSVAFMAASAVLTAALVGSISGAPVFGLAALLLAFCPLIRSASTVTEVFPLTGLWFLLLMAVPIVWGNLEESWLLAAFLSGLGLAVHQTLVFALPAVIYLLRTPQFRRPSLKRLLVVFLVGFGINAFMFVRAWSHPVLSWEDARTFSRWLGLLTRSRYGFFQLAQGPFARFSLDSLLYAFQMCVEALLNNVGFSGLFFIGVGIWAAFFHAYHRRKITGLLIAALGTGPVLLWWANASPQNQFILERFLLVPFLAMFMVMACGIAAMWASKIHFYRGAMAVLALVLVIEVAMKSDAATPLRWDLALRESALNVLRSTPKDSQLLSDRADETEFSLAYLFGAEKRRPDIRFVDCNAAVTPSIYGDDYYRIWGAPRLERRVSVEGKIVDESTSPVMYATADPAMISLSREPMGLLFRAWPSNSKPPESEYFPWLEVTVWRFKPIELRVKNLLANYGNILGDYFLSQDRLPEALTAFGISQEFGGTHRFEQLGFWHQRQGNIQDAREAYMSALAKGARSETLYVNLGALEFGEGRSRQAMALYEEGLRLFPSSINLMYNLAVVQWDAQNWDEVVRILTTVVTLNPQHAEARRLLSEARRRSLLNKKL